MRNKSVVTGISLLILLTTLLAAVHSATRVSASTGYLHIENGMSVQEISVETLEFSEVKGNVINAKGEQRKIDTLGVLLSEILEKANVTAFSEIKVVADDEYSAIVTKEEVLTEPVYLIQTGDVLQMIVFGDNNSRRNVSNVVRLIVS